MVSFVLKHAFENAIQRRGPQTSPDCQKGQGTKNVRILVLDSVRLPVPLQDAANSACPAVLLSNGNQREEDTGDGNGREGRSFLSPTASDLH